jgi:hypothetical protein
LCDSLSCLYWGAHILRARHFFSLPIPSIRIFLPYRGPTCCAPAIFSLGLILSWPSLLLIIRLFVWLAVIIPRPPIPRGFHPAV